MNRYWVLPVLALGASFLGCGGAKTIETGPKLDVALVCNFTRVQSPVYRDSPPPSTTEDCDPDSSTNSYPISIEVDETDGDKHNDGMENENTKYPAKTYTTTLTINDVVVTPAPVLKPSGSRLESDPIPIPLTSKGQTVKLHIEATDERGLSSNKVDLQVLLN